MESYATANFIPNEPIPMDRITTPSDIRRFLRFVKRCPRTQCWIWQGATDGRKGYGRFKLKGVVRAAHRVAYAMFIGAIDEGQTVDHTCYNARCVCPSHLRPLGLIENSTSRRCDIAAAEDYDDCPF